MAGTPSAHQIPSGSHNPISFNPLTARSLYSHHPTADRKWLMGARLLLRKLVLFLARHASTLFDIWPFNPCLLSRPFPRSRDGWRTGPAKSSMEYLGFAEIVRTAVAKKLAKSDLPSPPKEIVFQRQTYPENKTVKTSSLWRNPLKVLLCPLRWKSYASSVVLVAMFLFKLPASVAIWEGRCPFESQKGEPWQDHGTHLSHLGCNGLTWVV